MHVILTLSHRGSDRDMDILDTDSYTDVRVIGKSLVQLNRFLMLLRVQSANNLYS